MFRQIHIGKLIQSRMEVMGLSIRSLAHKTGIQERMLYKLLQQESLESNLLLQLSKSLNYDFFRIYTHHLLLYSRPNNGIKTSRGTNGWKTSQELPEVRKVAYSPEIISHIVYLIGKKRLGKKEAIEKYGIPKTTLYRWCRLFNIQ